MTCHSIAIERFIKSDGRWRSLYPECAQAGDDTDTMRYPEDAHVSLIIHNFVHNLCVEVSMSVGVLAFPSTDPSARQTPKTKFLYHTVAPFVGSS